MSRAEVSLYPHLLSPLDIGRRTLRNRVVTPLAHAAAQHLS